MKNLFQRIKHRKFVYTQPFQHIVYRNLINLEEFDRLYENMHYFNGPRWTEWKKEYGLDCELFDDVSKINYDNECMALWFFTDRNERSAKNDVEIYSARTGGRKVVTRWANELLFFEHNHKQQIRLLKRDKNWSTIKRPVVQFKFSLNTYKELVKKLTK